MCGIAGHVGHPSAVSEHALSAMSHAISYRGRDAQGEWHGEGARLFHSRLSIIDLESGDQPMLDSSGRFVIVFNGEIYNFLELKKQYEARGATFRSHSDTEVILEGYKLKGEKVCEDLNGMFAFAIWDIAHRRLFLARDRLGKKPLYWVVLGGIFYFSSTLDAFRDLPGWTGELSKINVDVYGSIGSFPLGGTAFRQGHSLAPATFAIYEQGMREPKATVYWRFDFSLKRSIGEEDAIEEFESLLTDAIAIRLRADVPIALTFSGGVDSGLIAALSKKRLGHSMPCWTIDYHTEDDPSEETLIASRVARLLDLDWHYEHFDYYSDFIAAIKEALTCVDQPCNNPAIGYSRRLYARIRREAKVVLTGNGADELFLGYAGNEELVGKDFVEANGANFLKRVHNRMLMALGKRLTREQQLARMQMDYVRANIGHYGDDYDDEIHQKMQLMKADIEASNVSTNADLYTYMALRYYTCDANFRLPDIAGLEEQVEVRSPFLDYRMVEFASRLPAQLKVGNVSVGDSNKYLLKRAYQRHVPTDIAWAKKKGMGANLRYDAMLAADPRYDALYASLAQRIDLAGLRATSFKAAWSEFVRDVRSGVRYPPSAGRMIAGLMLGLWLDRAIADERYGVQISA